MKFRLLNKIYANVFGYFWLPCPSCGKMFGGHEYVFFSKTKLVDGRCMGICPDCNNNPAVIDESLSQIVRLK